MRETKKVRFGYWVLAVTLAAGLIVAGPNLIWLSWSTASVVNRSSGELRDVRLRVGLQDATVDAASPRGSEFVFLPLTGESTLRIRYEFGGESRTGGQEYVE